MKSIRIPAKVAREIRDMVGRIYDEGRRIEDTEAERLFMVLTEPTPKKFVVAAKKRVKAKKAERQDEWAQIREKVFERALGHCENCHAPSDTLTPGHMFGGKDRKTLQSAFTVWALCLWCRRAKTDAQPSRETWLRRFVQHCANQASKYGNMAEDEPNGYAHAASIAKAKLESRQIQGRAK